MAAEVNTGKMRGALADMKSKLMLMADFALRSGESAGLNYLKRTSRFRNRTGNLRASFMHIRETDFTRTYGVSPSIKPSKGPTPFEYGRFVDNRVKFMAMAQEHAFVAMTKAIEQRLSRILGS